MTKLKDATWMHENLHRQRCHISSVDMLGLTDLTIIFHLFLCWIVCFLIPAERCSSISWSIFAELMSNFSVHFTFRMPFILSSWQQTSFQQILVSLKTIIHKQHSVIYFCMTLYLGTLVLPWISRTFRMYLMTFLLLNQTHQSLLKTLRLNHGRSLSFLSSNTGW